MQANDPMTDGPDVAARVDSFLSPGGRDSIHTVAAAFEATFTGPPASSPAQEAAPDQAKKKTYYDSHAIASVSEVMHQRKISSTSSDDHAQAVLSRVAAMMNSGTAEGPALRSSYSPPVGYQPPTSRFVQPETQTDIPKLESRMPASSPEQALPVPVPVIEENSGRRWSRPAGYSPASRCVQPEEQNDIPKLESQTPESSLAKTWSPPSGYEPRNQKQNGGTPTMASPISAPSHPFPSAAPMASAPAKKWEPAGGYDPKNRQTPSVSSSAPAAAPVKICESSSGGMRWAAPAQSYAPSTALCVPAESYFEPAAPTTMMAPPKKWEPYGGGYDPKARKVSALEQEQRVLKRTPAQVLSLYFYSV